MRIAIVLTVALSTVFSSPALARGPIRPFKVGNWNGGGYTNDATGQFSHCAMSSVYNSGITLFVSVTTEGSWLLGFSQPNWRLVIGQAIPVDLTFDGRGPVRVYTMPRSSNFVVVSMPPNGAVIKAFRDARMMTAFASGNEFVFSLTSTDRMFASLVQCVRSHGEAIAELPAGNGLPRPGVPVAPQNFGPPPAPPSPETSAKQPENSEAVAERNKLLSNAAFEYGKCIQTQMRNIVPYSNESAEVLSQVMITKCKESEENLLVLAWRCSMYLEMKCKKLSTNR